MRKQELIHTHGLLKQIADTFADEDELSDSALADYRSLKTSPTSIHASKTDHKNAVFELLDAVADSCEEDDEETTTEAPAPTP